MHIVMGLLILKHTIHPPARRKFLRPSIWTSLSSKLRSAPAGSSTTTTTTTTTPPTTTSTTTTSSSTTTTTTSAATTTPPPTTTISTHFLLLLLLLLPLHLLLLICFRTLCMAKPCQMLGGSLNCRRWLRRTTHFDDTSYKVYPEWLGYLAP